MSAGTATLAEADFTHRQVEVVVYHRKVGEVDSELPHQLANCFAAEVHVSLRSRHHQFHPVRPSAARPGLSLFLFQPDTLGFREVVEAHEADVVAIVGVNSPRVTQSDD